MRIERRYYLGVHDGLAQGFIIDANAAHLEAHRANDSDGARAVLRLWLDYFDNELGRMNVSRLVDYLETRQFWQRYKEWTVIKNAGEPCIAFTAQKNPGGDVTLIALGICYRYPGGDEIGWWNTVILPRLMRL